MYCLVLPNVCTLTYSYVPLVICLYQYVQVPSCEKIQKVHTGTYTIRVQGGTRQYKPVHTGMYQYIPVCTAINQVYHRIPDEAECRVALAYLLVLFKP
jgi:hypothetical protein